MRIRYAAQVDNHGEKTMDATKRLQTILTASPAVLAKVDALLAGDESHLPRRDPDTCTCTLTEAARRLNVSRPTVYRLIKRGALKSVELNGVSRVSLQSLFNFAGV